MATNTSLYSDQSFWIANGEKSEIRQSFTPQQKQRDWFL